MKIVSSIQHHKDEKALLIKSAHKQLLTFTFVLKRLYTDSMSVLFESHYIFDYISTMENLKVTLVQTSMEWEDINANLIHFAELIDGIKEETDLILLPEMFTTGFSMNPENIAEENEGPSLKWMQKQAKSKNAAISGSVVVREGTKFFNRLYFVFPDGDYQTYDKRHLFTHSGEDKKYSAGKRKLIVEYKGWKICPLICYDLRFPVWARNVEEYDLLLYGANWPSTRILAWDTLLAARSIENLCYTIGINRTGLDPNNNTYNGHSAGYDAVGEKLSTEDWEEDFVETIVLKKSHVLETRKQFQFLKDKDNFMINYYRDFLSNT